MTERITNEKVQFRLDAINSHFERAGKNTQWEMVGQYGYQTVYSGPADGYAGQHTVITGCTKREIYEALGVALEALRVLDQDPLPSKAEREKREADLNAYYKRMKKLHSNLKEANAEGMI
jgi:hypothetical protein